MSIILKINSMDPTLKNELDSEIKIVRSTIIKHTRTKYHGVRDIIEDVLDLNGKMLRPLFVLLAGHFGEYTSNKMVNLAASIEMLHMATLIHDDIVDDSKLRRHRESVQSKYGKDMAVYTGDFLLAKSLSILNAKEYEATHIERLAKGIERICEAELLQYQSRFKTMTFKNYLRIVSGKTAALFAISLYVGASESKCDDKLSNQLGRIGYELGIAFQIIDDILDFSEDHTNVGKSIKNDMKKGYFTLPVILALEDQKLNIEDFSDSEELLEGINLDNGIESSRIIAKKYTKKAFKRISNLPESVAKNALESVAKHMLDRNY